MSVSESEGIVIRSTRWSDTSLILTFFTPQGKVQGIARSALKPRSKFIGSVEPLQHVQYIVDVKENRDLSYIKELDLKTNHYALSERSSAYYSALFLCEILEKFIYGEDHTEELFELFENTLRAFHTARHPESFVFKFLIEFHHHLGYDIEESALLKLDYADKETAISCVRAISLHEIGRLDRISVNPELKHALLNFFVNHLMMVTDHRVSLRTLAFMR